MFSVPEEHMTFCRVLQVFKRMGGKAGLVPE